MRKYIGRCRCRGTELHLRSRLLPEQFQPRSDAETCNFCKQYDGTWISDPEGTLVSQSHSATQVKKFASEQVQFHFCAACGELIFARAVALTGRWVAVARVALFEDIRHRARPVLPTVFDGESEEAAGSRRSKNWTPLELSADKITQV